MQDVVVGILAARRLGMSCHGTETTVLTCVFCRCSFETLQPGSGGIRDNVVRMFHSSVSPIHYSWLSRQNTEGHTYLECSHLEGGRVGPLRLDDWNQSRGGDSRV